MAATKIADITLSKQSNTKLTLLTNSKYINNDVYFNISAPAEDPVFDGGDISGNSTALGTNVNLSNTDNGIMIQTAYTATTTDILYNGAVNGWVNKADDVVALAGKSKASTNGTAYFISGVTIPKPSGDTPNTFTVTLPNGGSDTITLTFSVDQDGNWSFE